MPFCPSCGKEVSDGVSFCPNCGRPLSQAKQIPPPQSAVIVLAEQKNPGLAAVLAIVLGIFGIWGIGHIYVGKLTRGIVLLVVGILVVVIGFFGIFVGFAFGIPLGAVTGGPAGALFAIGTLLVAFVVLVVAWIAGWIWQTYDAYKLAKQFNQHVRQTGSAPW